MSDRCDKHFTWVACNPKKGPGAYASCTADDEYANYAADFKRKEEKLGATVKRVTCNEAHRLMQEYISWIDGSVESESSVASRKQGD